MCFEDTLRKNEFIKAEFRDTKVFLILNEEYAGNGCNLINYCRCLVAFF